MPATKTAPALTADGIPEHLFTLKAVSGSFPAMKLEFDDWKKALEGDFTVDAPDPQSGWTRESMLKDMYLRGWTVGDAARTLQRDGLAERKL